MTDRHDKSYGTMRHVLTFAVATIRVGSRRNLAYFPSGTESMGDRGSKKAYTVPRKFGCDRSIVVGCWSRNDRQTSRQIDKQNGMTIRLTLCERDAIIPRRRSRCVDAAISGVCDLVYECVCLCVSVLKGKRLELSTRNLVHVAIARYALEVKRSEVKVTR